jgi:hypothetical protein
MTGLSVPAAVLVVMSQKLVILEKLFDLRRFQLESSRGSRRSENFCEQLGVILDIAFFHSLNLSLFDPDNSLNKVYQVFDLYDRPYDLPKSIKSQTMCFTSQ